MYQIYFTAIVIVLMTIALIKEIYKPSFILFIAPVEIIFMLGMIKLIEEPEAVDKFGDEYLNYKKQIPWFCFKIKCLKELLKDIPKNNAEK